MASMVSSWFHVCVCVYACVRACIHVEPSAYSAHFCGCAGEVISLHSPRDSMFVKRGTVAAGFVDCQQCMTQRVTSVTDFDGV